VVTSNPGPGGRRVFPPPPHVRREHQDLRAEPFGDLGDEPRPRDRRRVHPDLVRAGPQQRVDIGHGPHPPADGQRDEDLLGGAANDVVGGLSVRAARGHVEEGELVGALAVITVGELDRIARVAQVAEVDALDDPAGVDVEAGDHPDGDGHDREPSGRAVVPYSTSARHRRRGRSPSGRPRTMAA